LGSVIPITCNNPVDQFLFRFLTDVSDAERARAINALLTFFSLRVYIENAPTNTVGSIANDFKNCIEPQIGDAATITAIQLGKILLSLVVLTAVFMILIVILLVLVDKNNQPFLTIGLVMFFALMYIIIGWLLVHNTSMVISNEITNIQNITDNCINNAVTELDIYEQKQANAINLALCAYPALPKPEFGLTIDKII
jgi:hypothetical protein